jgi:hypothetical protein
VLQIVVLRGGALGDIVLTLPILQALRDFYPDCFVTLVAPYPHPGALPHGSASRSKFGQIDRLIQAWQKPPG